MDAAARDSGGRPGSTLALFHRRHMLLSCVTAVIVYFISPPLLAWVSPALLGLFLAVPLSGSAGSEALGKFCRAWAAAHAGGS